MIHLVYKFGRLAAGYNAQTVCGLSGSHLRRRQGKSTDVVELVTCTPCLQKHIRLRDHEMKALQAELELLRSQVVT